jgi:beta-galactosidase
LGRGLGPALDRVHAAFPTKPVIVSEYGLEPHWYLLGGPSEDTLDPSQYYLVSRTILETSDLADAERRRLIAAQLPVFRSRPWVVGAVYWTYQDYRTDSNFVMGVVDEQRRRRGSWKLLRREYAPVAIEAVHAGAGGATVRLRTRSDLPSYTLRGYLLRWQLRSAGSAAQASGSVRLPDLPPGSTWSGRVRWSPPRGHVTVALDIARPTGFSVADGVYAVR